MKNALITHLFPDPNRGVYDYVGGINQPTHIEIWCSCCGKKTITNLIGYGYEATCSNCGVLFYNAEESHVERGRHIHLNEISAKFNEKGNIQVISRYKAVSTFSKPGGLGIKTEWFNVVKVVNPQKHLAYQLPIRNKHYEMFCGTIGDGLTMASDYNTTFEEVNIVRQILGYAEISPKACIPNAIALAYPEAPEEMLKQFTAIQYNLINKKQTKEALKVALTHELPVKISAVTNKEIRQMMMQNIAVYPFVKSIVSMGLKSPDNISKIIKDIIVGSDNHQERCLRTLSGSGKDFLKWYAKDKKETVVTQCIIEFCKQLRTNSERILDTLNMFTAYEKDLRKMPNTGNLKTIHDNFYHRVEKLLKDNRIIEYTSKERKLEGEYGGYTFELAPSTDDLYDIGYDMGICVGGYSDDAYAKCFDILMVKKDGKNEACLQIDYPEKAPHMINCKKSHNMIVREPVISAIKEWGETVGVNLECQDWTWSITNAPDHHNGGDWHVENPRFQRRQHQMHDFTLNEDDLLF